MTLTDVKPEALALYKQETEWCLFLKSLHAADFHALTKGQGPDGVGTELILHDRYAAGEITFLDIVDALINPAHMDGLIGVVVEKHETEKDAEQQLLEILDRRKKISED